MGAADRPAVRAVTRLGALLVIAAVLLPASPAAAQSWAVSSGSSPRALRAVISRDAAGAPAIAISRGAKQLLPSGGLGLRTAMTDLTRRASAGRPRAHAG